MVIARKRRIAEEWRVEKSFMNNEGDGLVRNNILLERLKHFVAIFSEDWFIKDALHAFQSLRMQ